jgi:tetratricopeptide (TPR) repeat protein
MDDSARLARPLTLSAAAAVLNAHMIPSNRIPLVLLAAILIVCAPACENAAIQANEQQVQQQQAQIQKMQEQIAALKSGQSYSTTPPAPGSCDKSVMAEASRHGGDKMASGDFSRAVGYYNDALTACPDNAQAEVNLARAYEAMHESDKALANYRLAAASTDPADASAVQEARLALKRLGSSPK